MVINRSKHNKYTTGAIYGNLTSGGITTDANGNVTASDGLGYSGGIIYINGGAGGGISLELIDMLTNLDAFSYFNVSDGINTVNVEAKLEKDYINLNIIGDNESVETKVSTEKYLPETYYNSTGLKPGRYSVSYNKILIPDISGGDPIEIIKWVITIKKVYGDPIFPSTDFNGVLLLEDGNSLGAFSIDSDRLTVTSNQTIGLLLIVIQLDSLINFTEIRLISSEDYTSSAYTTITDIKDITIQTFTTVLISLAGATRYWKLDENGKLFTEYDVYTTKTLGAKDLIWSDKGYRVGNFVQGISGGIFHINDEIGTVYAELDKLKVRKKAYFETLEIINVNTVGGKLIISPAGAITIRKVDINDTYYRCYFLGEQDGVEIENRFKVNDLAFSQNFNIKKPGNYELVANHYFWRKVVGVSTQVDSDGNHYIDLSITDCDTDSDIPHVNDVVAQLGNTNDPDRLSAMIFSSVDSESPRIMLCHGIDTYTLNATNYFDLGVNHATNQAYMNVYGNTYIGAKDGSTYIDYSQTNGLTIKAHISASSTYGGQLFSDVFVTSENLSSSVKAIVGDDLEFLLNLIDGNIESYFYDYSPTLNNYPAVEWTTEADKQRHNGDTFTNIQEFISDSLTPDAGKSWRWVKNDSGVWGWIPISDSDAVAALKKAGLAQDTADGKRKVFTQKPGLNDDYQVGDLWVNATFTDSGGLLLYSNDLLRANTAKNKGELFSITHWELASKYTDDTMASDALAKANAALAAATAAGSAATLAQTEINAYKLEIDDIFSDGVITTSERSRLNTLKDTINTTLFDVLTTYNNVYNNSALDGKTLKTALQTAYTLFSNSATALLNSVTTVTNKSTISKGDISAVDLAYSNFNTKYTDYVAALHAANLEIMNTLSNTAYANAVNKFAWLNGLFDPDQTTTIDGGVVTTGVLALGKTTSGVFNVNAGINGVSNSSYLGNGIALWFGGDMIDKDNYTAGNRPANVATSLIRFDGSGYLGYVPNSDSSKDDAAIWWDASGNIHANPLSFFVGPESVGLLLSAFQIVPTSVGAPAAQYIIQRAPFQEVRIGNAYLGYDVVNNAVYVYTRDEQGNEIACNFYARGGISMYGSGSGSGGAGGLDVDAMWDILGESGIEQIHPSHISTALIDYVNNIIVNGTGNVVTSITKQGNDINVSLGTVQGASSWADITGKPSWIGNSKPSYSFGELTGKPTTLAGYGITDAVTLGTAQTITGFKTFGVRTTTNTGEANRIEIVPYKHTGTWYVNVYDTLSVAYLRLRYGESDIPFSLSHQGDLTIAGRYIKSGGTSSQFLKADGSVDSNTYLTDSNLDHLYSVDTRSTPTLPNTFGNGLRAEFKYNSTNGLSDGGIYNGVLHFKPYGGSDDHSGGYPHQLGFTDNGNMWHRVGTSGTAWSTWCKLLDNNNYAGILDSSYVKKSGDTMTGPLTIQMGDDTKLIFNNTDGEKYTTISFRENGTDYAGINVNSGSYNFYSLPINAAYYTANTTTLCGNLNADLLDGFHKDDIYGYIYTTDLNNVINNSGISYYAYDYAASSSVINQPLGNNVYDARGVMTFYNDYRLQMSWRFNDAANLYMRAMYNGTWYGWGKVAFTTDNVASATKLQTARSIWGQSFDGTGNVSGSLTNVTDITASGLITANRFLSANIRIECDNSGAVNGHTSEINNFKNHLYLQHHTSNNTYICTGGGNVGIGTATPSYKLHVAGSVYSSDWYYSQSNGYFINTGNVYYRQKDGYPDIYTGNGNEICIGSKTTDIYVNYRKSNAPNTPVNWYWMNGTSSGYANFTLGNLLAKGGITMYSDIRKKNVLENFNLPLEKICAAPLFRFTYKDDDKSTLHIGSSAQYWQDVPGIVSTDSEGKYLTMDYNAMLSAVTLSLAKYTKKHETEIEKLKMENIQLRQRIEFLERRVA